MAYMNLKAEMARKGIKNEEIAKLLGVHRNSIYNKITGPNSFTIEESMKIRDTYFQEFELNYLFATDEAAVSI
jgi:plasmid maintenance system antidote protein VapI